ncbi:MAG: hypothetical protein ACUZ8H_12480 [Candidatus Anammoxibacter sp.]
MDGSDCKGGGVPISIRVTPELLVIKSGRRKRIRVGVLKEDDKRCSVEVTITVQEGADLIQELNDTVTTNRLGFKVVVIKTVRGETGTAVILFSAGEHAVELPILVE